MLSQCYLSTKPILNLTYLGSGKVREHVRSEEEEDETGQQWLTAHSSVSRVIAPPPSRAKIPLKSISIDESNSPISLSDSETEREDEHGADAYLVDTDFVELPKNVRRDSGYGNKYGNDFQNQRAQLAQHLLLNPTPTVRFIGGNLMLGAGRLLLAYTKSNNLPA